MTWISHGIIAYGLNSFIGFPVSTVILGSTAPDWTEDLFGVKEHRGQTHYLAYWIIAFIILLILYGIFRHQILFYGLGFIFGGLTHLFADSLTVSGIPVAPPKYKIPKIKLLKGMIRTGRTSEFIFVGFFVLFIFLVKSSFGGQGLTLFNSCQGQEQSLCELYKDGIIDLKEFQELKKFPF